MATWVLTTQHKKNAIERSFWYKDGEKIVREEGYRWGRFHCESDEQPDIDLKNPDGYELGGDCDWELDSLDDGCWYKIGTVARNGRISGVIIEGVSDSSHFSRSDCRYQYRQRRRFGYFGSCYDGSKRVFAKISETSQG